MPDDLHHSATLLKNGVRAADTNQLDELCVPLRGAYARLLGYVLSHDVIGADETTWKMLGGKQGSKTWRMWAVGCEDAVYYKIQESRSLESAIRLLGDYEGTIVSDGYQVYTALAKRYHCIELAHCWSHCRRKYVEIEGSFPAQAAEILAMIGELYAVEKLCPTGPPGDELRRQLRNERSRPVVERIRRWVSVCRIKGPPEGLFLQIMGPPRLQIMGPPARGETADRFADHGTTPFADHGTT